MQIEEVEIGLLRVDPENANIHTEDSIKAIMASLKEFGQQKPIVIDSENIVRAGNGTYRAAMRLCWQSVKVVRTSLTGAALRAYAIADNRTSELSDFDPKRLLATFEQIEREYAVEQAKMQETLLSGADLMAKVAEQTKRFLETTGFTEAERKKLESAGNVFPSSAKPPKPPKDETKTNYVVIVACSGEESQKQTFAALEGSGYSVRMATT